MKRHILLMTALVLVALPSFSFAAENDAGIAGPYFTGQEPAALGDNISAPTLSSAEDQDADSASKIEPAAGEGSVFTLPDDPSAVELSPTQPETLATPAKPIVPGMTVPAQQ